MNRLRGFSLLEVMLALVVVAIGIGVFLTVLSSNQREVAGQASGNDYSATANEVLSKYLDEVNSCNENPTAACPLVTDPSGTSLQNSRTAQAYLGRDKIGTADLSQVHIMITAQRSDDLSLS